MKLFLYRGFLFTVPIVLFILLYIHLDPFKVIKEYDVYLSDYVMIHRGYVSTKMYLKNKDTYHFDSFIFGSSRSCAHTSQDWENYLPSDCKAYSYGSWNEEILGIYKKLYLIDSLGADIRNAFFVFDNSTFLARQNFLLKDHYLISGKSELSFHLYYFKFYLDIRMIAASIDYKIFHTRRGYMKNFQGMKRGDLDTINNDWLRDKLPEDTLNHYKNFDHKSYKRSKIQQFADHNIGDDDEHILKMIYSILNKQNTNYKIVIAPLYDQIKINPEDLNILISIFGKVNVFDYSGINDITENCYNYFSDGLHYDSKVGKRIFMEIYTN
jgi:hypothetical protein